MSPLISCQSRSVEVSSPDSDLASSYPKLLYFIGVDWFFYSHFLDRAIAAQQAGYDVVVVTGITDHDNPLDRLGIKLVGIPFQRRSLNPIGLLRNLKDVLRVFQREKPDLVHLIALKPILVGSVACRMLGIKRVTSAVVGLGFAFSSEKVSARIVRRLLAFLFRFLLSKPPAKTVFENGDDLEHFVSRAWVTKQSAVLIRGAGVDINRFQPRAVHQQVPVVMLLSRMLWDKGIGEFVAAARQLRQQHGLAYARFILVGDSDEDNRGSIARNQLEAWHEEGVIEWWGYQSDVANVLAQATISCLPSYREGLPKSLLESLAMGLPCIATDVPGCREAVIDGVNGILVPPREVTLLAVAIEQLIDDPQQCEEYGRVSREMAVRDFSTATVNAQTLEMYSELLRNS